MHLESMHWSCNVLVCLPYVIRENRVIQYFHLNLLMMKSMSLVCYPKLTSKFQLSVPETLLAIITILLILLY